MKPCREQGKKEIKGDLETKSKEEKNNILERENGTGEIRRLFYFIFILFLCKFSPFEFRPKRLIVEFGKNNGL